MYVFGIIQHNLEKALMEMYVFGISIQCDVRGIVGIARGHGWSLCWWLVVVEREEARLKERRGGPTD